MRAYPSPETLAAEVDIVLICVSADQDVLEIVDAIAKTIKLGAIVVDMSTVSSETAKITRPLMPSAAPIRPASPVSTQQGSKHRFAMTPFRKACIFTTFRSVKTHALRLSRTKNLHFAGAPFPGISASV